MSADALPEYAVYEAPSRWRSIDLIADLHLSAATPRTLAACAAQLFGTDADAVFILGDLFEVWIGDDTRDQPFERDCVDMLRQASRHRTIGFMAGNRDFLVGPTMLAEAGVERLRDPTLLRAFGADWLLSHGDALCLEDVEYQSFRRTVRSPAWQQAFLARPIEERAGIARAIRTESQARKDGQTDMTVWADVDPVAAHSWLEGAGCTTMIHGHTHRPGEYGLGTTHRRVVLSDWDLETVPGRADVLRLDGDGLHRRAPIGRP